MPKPLAGTTAVLTGASRGIGRAIALRLAQAGADVALWARDEQTLAAVASEINTTGGSARATVVDITDPEAVDRAAADVAESMPPVRTLVNNAGAVLRKPTRAITNDEWRAMMAVNLDGHFYVTRAFLPDLERRGGRIINIASRAGREGTALLAAYCAAKHAVVGFTKALAEELRAGKVSVNAVCPGSVDTGMMQIGLPDARPDMSPDDIARTVLFLAYEAPAALTGACIDVYG